MYAYHDEHGAAKALPRNPRAEALAAACGIEGAVLHGTRSLCVHPHLLAAIHRPPPPAPPLPLRARGRISASPWCVGPDGKRLFRNPMLHDWGCPRLSGHVYIGRVKTSTVPPRNVDFATGELGPQHGVPGGEGSGGGSDDGADCRWIDDALKANMLYDQSNRTFTQGTQGTQGTGVTGGTGPGERRVAQPTSRTRSGERGLTWVQTKSDVEITLPLDPGMAVVFLGALRAVSC